MKKVSLAIVVFFSISIILSSFSEKEGLNFRMPWKVAGLTERQAAAHLLDRFTFGATPGEIDEVVKTGLEKWFSQQLDGKLNDDSLNNRLKEYDALGMSNQQIINTFPRQAKIVKNAIDEGLINKDSIDKSDKAAYRSMIDDYMLKKGYRREQELYRQFANQKILSAAYSNNQLQQVLTEFWYNHFNVSATKNDCSQFIPAYERDVIRPNTTGKFGDLLLATAQSPAMLFYLDNFNSTGMNEAMEVRQLKRQQQVEETTKAAMEGITEEEKAKLMEQIKNRKKNLGLNENYAREIMELHSLGVDGGYTQADVTEAAKVLTGWTVYPLEGLGPSNFARKLIDKFGEDNLIKKGFVHKGDFFFALNRHDDKEKTVLGKTFSAGGGYDEGVELINMLAHHPSTAKFISKKLAVRFVSDNPPQSLIDKMAASFTKNDGNIKQVLITMVSSPEFWQKEALREKTKSPFELVISTVRSLDANVDQPFMLYQWAKKMGQQLYYYQAPTGFPDKGQYWINTGSLLNRMKFGLAFAAQKIPGVSFNLAALNNNHEPESAMEALKVYSRVMMPERNVDATIKRLEPMVNDPALQQKVEEAAGKAVPNNDAAAMIDTGDNENSMEGKSNTKMSEEKLARQMLRKKGAADMNTPLLAGNNSMLAQVVGIIIGSPEFQRR
ncbi:MAG: DUF1800 domain-containing protein [Chitinophagaceae bacterium]|nr:DUF1800 domain-containing protein [Chitinophagaceae bacterium]